MTTQIASTEGPASASDSGAAPADSVRLSPLAGFQALIEPEIGRFLDSRVAEATALAPDLAELTEHLSEFIARGGKRLRPALVYFTYLGCGGDRQKAILPLAMATELLHTYLLIHDDIMDSATLRRGRPTAHVLFCEDHRQRSWPGSSERHGESVAILLGDLAHSYAVELFLQAQSEFALPELSKSFSAMCQEVVLGQYLEMTALFRTEWRREDLLEVLRLKSGRYSVERPIELGALAAGASDEVVRTLGAYAAALGETFQLKDDLLGVFGTSHTVGKSVDSDIAEGKFTVLVQQAFEHSDEDDRTFLRQALGKRDISAGELGRVRRIVEDSGARTEVERMIERRLERAAEALSDLVLEGGAQEFFNSLIDFLRDREH